MTKPAQVKVSLPQVIQIARLARFAVPVDKIAQKAHVPAWLCREIADAIFGAVAPEEARRIRAS
jgi:hypothetical protein